MAGSSRSALAGSWGSGGHPSLRPGPAKLRLRSSRAPRGVEAGVSASRRRVTGYPPSRRSRRARELASTGRMLLHQSGAGAVARICTAVHSGSGAGTERPWSRGRGGIWPRDCGAAPARLYGWCAGGIRRRHADTHFRPPALGAQFRALGAAGSGRRGILRGAAGGCGPEPPRAPSGLEARISVSARRLAAKPPSRRSRRGREPGSDVRRLRRQLQPGARRSHGGLPGVAGRARLARQMLRGTCSAPALQGGTGSCGAPGTGFRRRA